MSEKATSAEAAWREYERAGWKMAYANEEAGSYVADYRSGGATMHVDATSLEHLCQKIGDWHTTRASMGLSAPQPVVMVIGAGTVRRRLRPDEVAA